MNRNRWALVSATLLLAGLVVAQTTTQTRQQTSQSGTGHATASSSASASSNGSRSANGSGSGSGSGFSLNGKPTHAIMYSLSGQAASAQARQQTFDVHSRYLGDQQKKGKVLLFGPWRDLPGSMAIVVANSDDEANAIARNDPAVQSGNLNYEVRAWNVTMPSGG